MTVQTYATLSEIAPVAADNDFGANLTAIKGINTKTGVDILIHSVTFDKRPVYDAREERSLVRDFTLMQISTVEEPEEIATYHSWSQSVFRRLQPLAGRAEADFPVQANLRNVAVNNGFKAILIS